jgi:hypothetical protein
MRGVRRRPEAMVTRVTAFWNGRRRGSVKRATPREKSKIRGGTQGGWASDSSARPLRARQIEMVHLQRTELLGCCDPSIRGDELKL